MKTTKTHTLKRLTFWLISQVARKRITNFADLFKQDTPRTGRASWTGDSHRGKLMADGWLFNPDLLTCATDFYRLGTRLEVCCGRRSVTVLVTDRGPDKKQGRLIDLSRAAWSRIAPMNVGIIHVTVSVWDPETVATGKERAL